MVFKQSPWIPHRTTHRRSEHRAIVFAPVPLTQLFPVADVEIFGGQISDIMDSGMTASGISFDSRQVRPGHVFFALPGLKYDGRQFLKDAQERGAVAIVADKNGFDGSLAKGLSVPVILHPDAQLALALCCAAFFKNPSNQMLTIGVTGTNGKTSVAWILAEALFRLGHQPLLVGTLGTRVLHNGCEDLKFVQSQMTTPDPVTFFSNLSCAFEKGASALVMEVSSHSIEQQRVAGVQFNAAVFTNLTHDHLDYHADFDAYGRAKQRLFSELLLQSSKHDKISVINIDDPFGRKLYDDLPAAIRKISVSLEGNLEADVCVQNYQPSLAGTEIQAKVFGKIVTFRTKLVGGYNVSNVLSAASVLIGVGFQLDQVVAALSEVPPVPGRLEVVAATEKFVFVDYAHTPDALFRAQQALREVGLGRLITVFGCGGDRDRAKRPVMAQMVQKFADFAIVTSDNPRSEKPGAIIDDIVQGFSKTEPRPGFSYIVIEDRKAAIQHAITLAQPGDAVLVAGKGHEDYQEIMGVRHAFSDQEIVKASLGNAFNETRGVR